MPEQRVDEIIAEFLEKTAQGTEPERGRLLASSSHDGTVKLWDVAKRRLVRTLIGHAGPLTDLAFSPDERRLVTAGLHDHDVKLWDVEGGHGVLTLRGHISLVYAVAFSSTGNYLATAGDGSPLKIFDGRHELGD